MRSQVWKMRPPTLSSIVRVGHLGHNHGAARGATGGEGVKPGERGVSGSSKNVGKEARLIPREETRWPR